MDLNDDYIINARRELKLYMTGFFRDSFKRATLQDANKLITELMDKYDLQIFHSMHEIIYLRFLLTRELLEYLIEFPELIKQYQRSSELYYENSVHQVGGSINWKKTLNKRARMEIGNNSFVINRKRNINEIDENLVFNELVQLFFEWETSDRLFKIVTQSEQFQNVHKYLSSIKNTLATKGIVVFDAKKAVDIRILDKVAKNKRSLYSKAAILLKKYRLYKEDDSERIGEMLAESFVEASKDDVCYELFWAFKLFFELVSESDDVTLYPVYAPGDLICCCKHGNYRYELHHNVSKTDNSNFNVNISELDHKSRYDKHLFNQYKRLCMYSMEFVGRSKKSSIFSYRRPDIVIEKINEKTGKLEKVIIGEVKNTTNIDYALEGMSELIEYTEIASKDDKLDTYDSKTSIMGVLCTGPIDEVIRKVSKDKHVQWRMP